MLGIDKEAVKKAMPWSKRRQEESDLFKKNYLAMIPTIVFAIISLVFFLQEVAQTFDYRGVTLVSIFVFLAFFMVFISLIIEFFAGRYFLFKYGSEQ